ncbi:UNVERIFIED_CONTAM: hypothetical protein K2H54_066024 [Gekko kuhli]
MYEFCGASDLALEERNVRRTEARLRGLEEFHRAPLASRISRGIAHVLSSLPEVSGKINKKSRDSQDVKCCTQFQLVCFFCPCVEIAAYAESRL